ncbi:DHHW family protein [Clostridium aestuarii]|uniref:DHHW family protein n=1 Tax=Clostridium aestuarii TaxID=338193 RepID=A0ABT4D0U5_9CLOT|nr:DHHW family protein [Clostridium aestuarii]MCY6484864.1 DHHW family protein [Clostridium aestuarii]
MNKRANKILVIMFITFLFSINILNIVVADKTFSQSENRLLQQLPKLTWNNLVSGRFSSKFEKYITDQFVFKDFWVALKSDADRLRLKSENNGIFFGKAGYLLENYKKPDKQLEDNIHSINVFGDNMSDLSTYLLLVPNSVKVYEDKLPLFASPYDQLKTIENVKKNLNKDVKFIDVYDKLYNNKDEYIYFRTDHHWTMKGAYYAYQMLAEKLGFKPYDISEFDSKTVSDEFYGTFYSRANNSHISSDAIEIFQPKFDTAYTVDYPYENKSMSNLYEFKHLLGKDKYSLFLDGNHSLMTIKTNVKNNKKIVIFKDSYAHCFIPFLANHYEEIHVIDLRYYKLNVYEYIQEHKIKEVLFLYNVTTFSSDTNIIRVK